MLKSLVYENRRKNNGKRVIDKIISGGQTGADRAGLDLALARGIPHGGAIPWGRRTEAGILPDKYQLVEMETDSYPARSEKNILDADVTVIFTHGKLAGGSLFTRSKARQHNKPVLHIDLDKRGLSEAALILSLFLRKNRVKVVNVAGTRASKDPAIYRKTYAVLDLCLERRGVQLDLFFPE
ncbi:conserved hypothetical protein [Desulfotalea psychrophila LSv54]|uniref:Molybdenum carrier n=1 Tax=Desulfotalea psychrophila (strain LSv54 / DSM 12343) TaxID=177439 RepID=Q6AKK2_DESPS|nr:conserved hypothetical protein [Desulfotalea psychrophila LSv54]